MCVCENNWGVSGAWEDILNCNFFDLFAFLILNLKKLFLIDLIFPDINGMGPLFDLLFFVPFYSFFFFWLSFFCVLRLQRKKGTGKSIELAPARKS